MTTSPPVFHLTHWKAGSQWIRGVLECLFPDRVVNPLVAAEHVTREPIRRGGIYPTVYLEQSAFAAVQVPDDSIVFLVLRDLRDTLISNYYSLLESHPLLGPGGVPHPGLAELRRELSSRTLEEGLLYLTRDSLDASARIQASWMDAGVRVFRYEDFVADGRSEFGALLDFCGLACSEAELLEALEANSFETRSGGRAQGVEDTGSHFRKGVAGDWRNHFGASMKAAFKERFAAHLIRTGYETGEDW